MQINNRILTSQAKIEKLRSASTKAARVFSSPKYPAPEAVTDYHTIYEDINPICIRSDINHRRGREGREGQFTMYLDSTCLPIHPLCFRVSGAQE